MSEVDRLWAGWRSAYVESGQAPKSDGCVFCALFASSAPAEETNIVWRNDKVVAILNAFPYGTGHVLVMPVRHLSEMEDLEPDESAALWQATQDCVAAVKSAYRPGGVNIGANLGAAAGAGIPGHMHIHVLPRWFADTGFITAIANTRVLPEVLTETRRKLSEAWPAR